MFKIMNFQNKIVDKLLVFRCSEIPDTTYDIRYTIYDIRHTIYDTIMQNEPNFKTEFYPPEAGQKTEACPPSVCRDRRQQNHGKR